MVESNIAENTTKTHIVLPKNNLHNGLKKTFSGTLRGGGIKETSDDAENATKPEQIEMS